MRSEDLPGRANSAGAYALVAVPLVWIGIGVFLIGGAPSTPSQIGLGAVGFLITVAAAYVAGEEVSSIVRRA
jgi:hypothetical protein